MHTRRAIHITLLILALATLACRLPTVGPARPDHPEAISATAALAAERKINAARAHIAQGQDYTLTLTQQEVTSWLVLRAEEYAAQVGEPVPLEAVRVYFQAGVIRLYGEHHAGAAVVGVLVTVTPTVTPDGRLDAQITAAQFGPVALDDATLEGINRAVRDALASLRAYRISTLSVTDGVLTVSLEAAP